MGFPRTRGDGPAAGAGHVRGVPVSPHTRGWTRPRPAGPFACTGFPAHAGMDPSRRRQLSRRPGFPRTRGDGPSRLWTSGATFPVSPHTRGWTVVIPLSSHRDEGFPAHAGMDPITGAGWKMLSRFPRTRGDGPICRTAPFAQAVVSPHTRGWTLFVPVPDPGRSGFPAHAGMDPPRAHARARAGGFPAHAGMDPRCGRQAGAWTGFPRTRGDGPASDEPWVVWCEVSPHTRGWTSRASSERSSLSGFPAHAGMDPRQHPYVAAPPWFPRTRGDGPSMSDLFHERLSVSPHTRGWTSMTETTTITTPGFPAHAGMDPGGGRAVRHACRFPRTRGDGPRCDVCWTSERRVSPHTRGWTLRAALPDMPDLGFPAHAGMDPV